MVIAFSLQSAQLLHLARKSQMELQTNMMSSGKSVVTGLSKTGTVRPSRTFSNVVRNHLKLMKILILMYGRKDRQLESFSPGAMGPPLMLWEQFVAELLCKLFTQHIETGSLSLIFLLKFSKFL